MSDWPHQPQRPTGIRHCASPRAVARWGFNTALTLVAVIGLVSAGMRDGSGLARTLTAFVLASGVPLTILVTWRLLLEAGLAPRLYAQWVGDEVHVWTVASRITRRVVVGRRGDPIVVTRHYHATTGVLGGSTSDWVILADRTTRIAMTVYSYREPGVLEGLVAAVLAAGIPAEESEPIGRH